MLRPFRLLGLGVCECGAGALPISVLKPLGDAGVWCVRVPCLSLADCRGWLCSQLKRSLSSPSGARFILLSTNAGVLVGCAGRSADRLRGLGVSLSLRVRSIAELLRLQRVPIDCKEGLDVRGAQVLRRLPGPFAFGVRGTAAPPRWVFLGKAAPGFAGGLLRRWRVLGPFYSPEKFQGTTRRTLRKGVASSERLDKSVAHLRGLHELRLDALPEEPLSNVPHETRLSSLREGHGLGEGQESLWPFRFCEHAGMLDFGVEEGQDLALLLRSSRRTLRLPQAHDGPIQLREPLTRCAHASSRLRLLALVTSPPCGSAEGLAPYGARVLSAWPDGSFQRWSLSLGQASSLRTFLSHAELPSLGFNDLLGARTHRAELSYQMRQSLSGMSKPLAELQELGFQPACGRRSIAVGDGRVARGGVPGGRACWRSACQQRRGCWRGGRRAFICSRPL